ncbi:MAG: methylmalonyl-CoA mutase family protein [Hyphomicrobiaceae bacterium]
MTDSPLTLAADFPPADEPRWRALVDAALKGADFERRLVARTADGIPVRPVYRRAEGAGRAVPGRGATPWRIAQRVDHPDPVAASALAIADLEGGADMLVLPVAARRSARGFGLEAATVDALDRALSGIALDMIAIRLEPDAEGLAAARLADLVARRGLDPSRLQIDFGVDRIGKAAIAGGFTGPWGERAAKVAADARALSERGFNGPFLTVDLRPAHEAGASEVQELAIALSTGLAYLRALESGGLTLDAARRSVSFTIAVDADQVLGIAKLRALRRLWQRVEQVLGLTPERVLVHGETAWRMATRRDPAVNMLRATLATFAAGVGGVDSMTVLPHTLTLGLPDADARRIARNIQHVLIDEGQLARVADPAGGSGAIEALTDELADRAWTLMQEIEHEGGIVATLEAGTLQDRIEKVRLAREGDAARRRIQITGTSEFPPLAEPIAKVLGVPRRPAVPPSRTAFPPLPSRRLAEPFEALAERAAAHAARTGTRPTVFLANLGPLAEHSARALWITNLLAVGGIAVVSQGEGFTASGEAGAAFARSGAHVAVICGSDDTYALLGEATAQALANAGATRVYVAGRPGTLEAALSAAGVSGYLAAGQDILAALTRLHEVLDVKSV